MNTSYNPSSSPTHLDLSGGQDKSPIAGFSYGLGMSLGILILFTAITLSLYICTRNDAANSRQSSENQLEQQQQQQQQRRDNNHCVIAIEGIDEDTLKTYPEIIYSQLESSNKKGSTIGCSICLADYKDKDVLRQLPECGHVFHLKCVDPWLRCHPTCPVCRTSPSRTHQLTPIGATRAG